MKNYLPFALIGCTIILMVSSCTIEKRRYSSGYHIRTNRSKLPTTPVNNSHNQERYAFNIGEENVSPTIFKGKMPRLANLTPRKIEIADDICALPSTALFRARTSNKQSFKSLFLRNKHIKKQHVPKYKRPKLVKAILIFTGILSMYLGVALVIAFIFSIGSASLAASWLFVGLAGGILLFILGIFLLVKAFNVMTAPSLINYNRNYGPMN